jgi:CARDB
MRHNVLIAALVAAGLALGAAPAHAASSGVKLIDCESALDPAARAAVFEGRMRVRRGARKMQMRFTLQTRSPGDPAWRRLPASGFGKWLTSDPGIGRYVYTKRVVALEAPASYRTIVRFRWLDADGDRVASSRSTSEVCRQADLRPNLRPLGVEARAGADAQHARYLVPVVNRGRSPAGPFDVVVSVDGTTLTPAQAPELAPGERALVEVQGPPCQDGQMLTVDVDPTGAVDERAEGDNQLSVPCPGAPA